MLDGFRFHSFKEFETNCGLRGELTLFTGGDGNLSKDPGASDATAAAEQPTSGGSNAKEQLVSAAGNTLFKARSSCSSDGTEDPNIYLNHL
ncbi:hypothetical protein YC2023_041418 [Brassica napus]